MANDAKFRVNRMTGLLCTFYPQFPVVLQLESPQVVSWKFEISRAEDMFKVEDQS
jgi:hypothetical protein